MTFILIKIYRVPTVNTPQFLINKNMQSFKLYLYKAKILYWYDGDTLTVDMDLGFKIHTELRIRLARVDAWEINDQSSYRRRFARHARAVARQKFPAGSKVLIESLKRDRYGRWLAEVFYKNKNVSDWLLQSGEKGIDPYRGN